MWYDDAELMVAVSRTTAPDLPDRKCAGAVKDTPADVTTEARHCLKAGRLCPRLESPAARDFAQACASHKRWPWGAFAVRLAWHHK